MPNIWATIPLVGGTVDSHKIPKVIPKNIDINKEGGENINIAISEKEGEKGEEGAAFVKGIFKSSITGGKKTKRKTKKKTKRKTKKKIKRKTKKKIKRKTKKKTKRK